MFFIVKTLHGFLKLLNSETAPSQLAAGVGFGMVAGFTPFLSLHNLVVFLLVCLLRVNFSMFFLSLGLFSLLAFVLDPIFDWFGYLILVDIESLRPFWIQLSTGPIVPFFHFNNTVVAGSLVLSLVLFAPVFILMITLVNRYRSTWREKIQGSQFMKVLKATPIYGVYDKYQNLKAKFSLT